MGWLKALFRRNALERDIDREFRFHIDELTEQNIARGMSPGEAHRQAMLEFGGKEQLTQDLRDVHRPAFLDRAVLNLKAAIRFMRKSPSFSLVVIVTLALGIGANSAVFSAIDAILLRPLPFPDAHQLVLLEQLNPRNKSQDRFVAPVRLADWGRLNSTFQAITGYYTENISEISGPLPEKLTAAWVAPRFLEVWGVSPALGRDFSAEEHQFGGPNAILISDRFWHRRFDADPSAVGKSLLIGKHSFTITGVMPASFLFPDRDADLWSPVPVNAPYSLKRESAWYTVIGRLKARVTVAQARADLATIQDQLGKQYPQTDANVAVAVQLLKDSTVGSARQSLWLLFGSVTLLLLIACTNIAALLLARTSEREHEISVRISLGASRGSVVTQLLTEVFLLAQVGSVLGLGLAAGAAKLFRELARDLPRVDEIRLDPHTVTYTLVSAVLVTLLCGLLPAIRSTGQSLAGSLAHTSGRQVSSRNPTQWALVGVQVALAVTLLVGAGLLVRSFQELARVAPGFDVGRILTLRVSGTWAETADMKGLTQRIDRTLAALRAVPGVEGAATSANLPGVPSQFPTELTIPEGQEDTTRKVMADSRFVSAGYFQTMGIALLAGQPCVDNATSSGVVVNRSFARTYFNQSPAIGHHLVFGVGTAFPQAGEIRGIVADSREQGINANPMPTVYWCLSAPMPDPIFLIRTQTEPSAMAETLRREIHRLEPNRSVFRIMPLTEHLSDAFAENRLRTLLLSLFALTAVSLACIGIYGTLTYLVSVRHREVGLRLALGALRSQIVKRFLMQGVTVAVAGCAVGVLLAAGLGRLLGDMLYGVSSLDPATFVGVIVLVLAVAALASLAPAIRAARVNPMQVLRDE
jgi:putative ABC transport system permease protein